MNHNLTVALATYKEKKSSSLKQSSLFLLVLGSIGLLVLFCFLDYMIIMPQPLRWTVWLILLAVTFWRCQAYLKALKQELHLKDAARDIQDRTDDNNLLVLTAAETIESPKSLSTVGAQLEKNLQHQAQQIAENAPTPSTRPIMAYGTLALACAVALISFCYLTGMTSPKRILAPWSKITYTQVELHEPESVPEVGTPISISGKIKGRPVEVANASFDSGKEFPVTFNDSGDFQVQIPEGLTKKQELTVTAGDGTQTITLDPFVSPPDCSVESYEIEVHPPAYASRLARTESDPSFIVLRASSLNYQIRLNMPADEVLILPINPEGTTTAPAIRFTSIDNDHTIFQANIDIGNKDLYYIIQMTSKDGVVTKSEDPYQISSRQDSPPKLRIGSTNAEEIFDTKGTFEFKIHASDDVAITEMRFHYHKLGQPDGIKRLNVFPQEKPWSFSCSASLDLSRLGLEPLDLIVITAVAKDGNNIDGPGVGKSEPFLLEIPEPPVELPPPPKSESTSPPPTMVNPYEIQKQIFSDTQRIIGQDKQAFSDMANDQLDNKENTAKLAQLINEPEISNYLAIAQKEMQRSAENLMSFNKEQSIVHQEICLNYLIKARKLIQDQLPPPPPPGK